MFRGRRAIKCTTGPGWARGVAALLLAGGMAVLTACGQGGQDQEVADFGIAYIKRPIPTEVDDATGKITLVDPDVRESVAFNAGGDVYYRDRASLTAPERNLTACITGGVGDVKDLEVSYDGSKLIFSLRLEDTSNGQDVPKWNIYEYDTAGGACPRRIIQSDIFAQKGDDVAPYYLPDGHIVFSSSWQKTTGAVLLDEGKPQFPPLGESRNEAAVVLHTMSADGSNVQQISFNQSHDLDASVLTSGEIIFSRWDNMGRRNNIRLYKMRPDGTGLKPVYGVHDSNVGTNGGTVQFLSPRELEDGRLMVMLKPFNGSRGGGVPTIVNIAEYADNTEPTWPNQGVLTGPGQTPAVNLDVRTDSSISPAGHFRSVYPLWDGSNRALVSWSQCRLQKTETDNSVTLIPCPGTIPNNAAEAFPLYGIYIYNLDENTQLPVVVPQEGIQIDEPVVLAPRPRPEVLYDRAPGFELNSDLFDETVGILHIRSVYDFDGTFNALPGGAATSVAAMAMAAPDNRPARFLRIIKGASIPDRDVRNFNRGRAFGNSGQRMREIIGYAPIEPDGSVMVKVPANVPLAISVVDVNGRRIGVRHRNWIQVRPGEVVECNGCHNENSGRPHGYADQPPPVNTGAPTTGDPFPGTNPAITALIGETMAKTRFRAQCGADFSGVNFSTAANLAVATCPGLSPDVNVRFDDVWTDPAATPAPSFARLYSDLTPNPDPLGPSTLPTTAACAANWDFRCRTIISYEQHIHPIWNVPRTDPSNTTDPMNTDWTCASCHTDQVVMGAMTLVDAGQLDLSDGELNNRFESYEELFVQDLEEELVGGVFLDALMDNFVEETDAEGNPVFQTDPNTGEVLLDGNGEPIPSLVNEPLPIRAPPPVMSTRGASNSFRFFNAMQNTRHAGMLSDAELRLISEWLDIGAQYYNNPFDAP